MSTRRGFIFGLGATLAVIPAANLMKLWVPPAPKWMRFEFSASEPMLLYSPVTAPIVEFYRVHSDVMGAERVFYETINGVFMEVRRESIATWLET